MASADRVLQILELFTPARPAWNAGEAAQALKLSRASAYRYFALLEEAGFIEPIAGRRYALGPRIVELDRQIRLADPLVQASADEMVKLSRETGGIALLCRLYKDRVLCIHQERGVRAPRFVSDGSFPWGPERRADLTEVRQIGDVVLLRYALSERYQD